jgi:hypothetical protein
MAETLRETGEEMAGYSELPMGSHDPAAMASPRLVQTFAHLIDVERGAARVAR